MKSGHRVGILGVGSFLPETVRTNDWWPAEFRAGFEQRFSGDLTTPEVFLSRASTPAQRIQFEHMLETITDPFRGTRERRVLDPALKTSHMDIAASRQALERAGVDPIDVGAIINSSAPTDMCGLSNAGVVQAALGMKRAHIMGVDGGCFAQLSGMILGQSLIASGHSRYVLVVNSSAFTRLADPADPGTVNFGDGASAIVLGPVPSAYGFEGHAVRSVGELAGGIGLGPKDAGSSDWYEGKGRFYIHAMDLAVGREVVARSADFAVDAVETVLRKLGLEKKAITSWYAHQAVSWFSAACRAAAGLQHARTVDTFPKYTSVGAANIGVNLATAFEAGQLEPGERMMLYSNGAGFIYGALVVTWGGRA